MGNEQRRQMKGGRLFYAGGIITVAAAVVVVVLLLWSRQVQMDAERMSKAAAVESGPLVQVVSAIPASDRRCLEFLGEARPYASVTLYAKVSGYLHEIRVDKGDRVSAGQVLAVIETPELDQDYQGAVADARNRRSIAKRLREVVPLGGASREAAETAEAAAAVAEARASSLRAQLDYKVLRTPFPATVTARYADPGALVQSATSSQTTALPIVTLCQVDRLRVEIYPDQRNASLVRIGDPGEVWDTARPDVRLPASVNRTSGELDPKTRTLLVELDLDNRDGIILPNSFVQVSLCLKTPPCIEVPVEALIMRRGRSCVAVVDGENRASFRDVVIYESDGRKLKLRSGLNAGERVALHLGDTVAEGSRVRPAGEDRR
jgi:RND family efflux transporter MFP subunit